MTLDSKLGKGTTFTARLPFKKASLSNGHIYSPPLDYSGERAGVDKSAIKILLAEGEPRRSLNSNYRMSLKERCHALADNDVIREIVVRTLKKLKVSDLRFQMLCAMAHAGAVSSAMLKLSVMGKQLWKLLRRTFTM